MQDLALIVNTVDKNKDVWPLFFKQIEKHIVGDLFKAKYIFVNHTEEPLPVDYNILYFDKEQPYQQQFVSCIKDVPEKYCIYISEDYILYSDVRTDLIKEYCHVLSQNPNVSFIRFMKGGVVDVEYPPYQNHNDLYEMHHSFPYFYTNQAALWQTRDLEKIHVHGPPLHIGNLDWQNSFEFQATRTCQELDIRGLFCYHGEPKRGIYHYDCKVFPHISTALVKGKWNISEYKEELASLLKQYSIDIEERGVVEC